MTDEEMRKRMEFIIEQQAQLVINQEKAEERITRLENAQIQTELRMGELAEAQARMLAAQERMSRSQEHMNEVVAVMADAQTRTDERLDTFIEVLERYISEGRNGKSE
jgi:hypothetical protein